MTSDKGIEYRGDEHTIIARQQAEIERLQAVEELLRQAFDGEVTYDDFGQWYDECQEVFGRVSQTHEEVSDDE